MEMRSLVIDAHTHIYPDKIAAATVRKLSGFTGLTPAFDGTADGLRRLMQSTGVDRSIVLPVATNPDKVDRLNDFAMQLDGSGGLVSLGAMHPDCPYWKTELDRLAAHGVRGIKIHPVYQGVDLDDLRYLRIFERAASLGLCVVTHAGYDIGFPGERRCMPQQAVRALEAVGEFSLVLAHMGGWEDWHTAEALLPHTGAYIDTSFALSAYRYINDARRDPAITAAFGETGHFLRPSDVLRFVRAFGAERILFGSDAPWDTPATALRLLKSLPLTEQELTAILGGNAQRLFC